MDIYCPRCGEPWDMDTLHEETDLQLEANGYSVPDRGYWSSEDRIYSEAYKAVRADFQRVGCQALPECRGTNKPCVGQHSVKAELAAVAYELLGDDLDGAAAMLEDWEAGY